ncbi:ABC transporter, ATP-binding protein [Lactiplantibacillus plantarum]|nr:ABC transporter, ATP-binding protein [Lactiplantibacillus plantarum]
MQQWTNQATRAQASLQPFNRTLIIYVLLYVGDASTIFIASLILARVTAFSTGTMRVGLFRKMQRMKVQYFDTHSDGDILARFTSDLDNIFNAMNQALLEILLAVAQFVGLLIVMFNQNTTMAWVTMASTPVALIIAAFVMHKAGVAVNQ